MLASIWHLAPDAWTAIATWTGVGIAAGAALTAGIVGTRQLSEAQRLRYEQAQPYVVVFLDESAAGPLHIDLVIKNFGATAATDIRTTFSAPLESAVLGPEHSPITTPDVIPVLVPGQEWRVFWDFTRARWEATNLPDKYTATVTYKDSEGKVLPSRDFEIDWRPVMERGHITTYTLNDAARALAEVRDLLKRWDDPRQGLRVSARDGDEQDRQEKEWWEQRRQQREREEP